VKDQLLAALSLQPGGSGSWMDALPRLPFQKAPQGEVASTSGASGTSTQGPQRRFPRMLAQQPDASDGPVESKNALRTARSDASRDTSDALCIETFQDRKRVYRHHAGHDNGRAWEGFNMLEDSQTNEGRVIGVFKSYLLPQGFPDSVAPQYAPYMFWRGVQYFFGGAMSVFTTKSLLGALGVAGKMGGGEAAAAINWVVKDGAGRFGRFLFARWRPQRWLLLLGRRRCRTRTRLHLAGSGAAAGRPPGRPPAATGAGIGAGAACPPPAPAAASPRAQVGARAGLRAEAVPALWGPADGGGRLPGAGHRAGPLRLPAAGLHRQPGQEPGGGGGLVHAGAHLQVRAWATLGPAHCPLPTAHCPLPTGHCPLALALALA
jgi:hypothetical protein